MATTVKKRTTSLDRRQKRNRRLLAAVASLLMLPVMPSFGISNNWSATPVDSDWSNPANWSLGLVPNSSISTAPFGITTIATPTLSNSITLDGISFTPGASAYTITAAPGTTLTMGGVGITNSSGIAQNFVTAVDIAGNAGSITFLNNANAGTLTVFTNNGAMLSGTVVVGVTSFLNTSSAGSAAFINNAGTAAGASGGYTYFTDTATAANGVFTDYGSAVSTAAAGYTFFAGSSSAGSGAFSNYAPTISGGNGGYVDFLNNSTAGNASFTNYGSTVGGTQVGFTTFFNTATAANATFTNDGATSSGGSGGVTQFFGTSTAANGVFINNPATVSGATYGGGTLFYDTATAGNGSFTENGSAFGGENGGYVNFLNNSTAGQGVFSNYGGTASGAFSGFAAFFNASTAANAFFTNYGATVTGATGGGVQFFNTSTAGAGVFLNNAGSVVGNSEGATTFLDTSSAANGTFTDGGSVVGGAHGGATAFFNSATAGNGVFTNDAAGLNGATGGFVTFGDTSTAGNGAFTNNGSAVTGGSGGFLIFTSAATAGSGVFTNVGAIASGTTVGLTTTLNNNGGETGAFYVSNGGVVRLQSGGSTQFFDTATAGNATFNNNAGTSNGATGGYTQFNETSTAGSGAFTNSGAAVSGANGGFTQFLNSADAGSGHFTNNGGLAYGAAGGSTLFNDSSSASTGTVTNNGGTVIGANGGSTQFFNTASAGSGLFMNTASSVISAFGGSTVFHDSSSASVGTFTNDGGTASNAGGGSTQFFNSATAGSGLFMNNAASAGSVSGGSTLFNDTSTASLGTFTNNGSTVSGAAGGRTTFTNSSTAGSATLIANGGTGGGLGGQILFFGTSTGGTARVEVFGNGALDLSALTAPSLTVGSLEGSGNVLLGANNLTVGNSLSTTFSGTIQDSGGGSLTKIGTGTLTLSGYNTYTGATVVNGGTLLVNYALSATSAVTVNNGGALGGSGNISGPVTVNSGGILVPGSVGSPGTLTVGPLTLNSGSILNYTLAQPGFNSLTVVNGDLALGGATLNITGLSGFSAGTYDLINYTGTLTGSGLTLGTLPSVPFAATFALSTAIPNQIELIVIGTTLQYWDGPNTTATGTVTGGAGTWNKTATSWTNASGSVNSAWQQGIAVFSAGSGTVTLGASLTTAELRFLPGSGAYTFALGFNRLIINDAGITNTSGSTQNFATNPGVSSIVFSNSATAGINTLFTTAGGNVAGGSGASARFNDNSTAGSGAFINNGGTAPSVTTSGGLGSSTTFAATGGSTLFYNNSTAGSGSFTNNGGLANTEYNVTPGSFYYSNNGGLTAFYNTSTAGQGTFTNNGTGTFGATGGYTAFNDSSTAGNGTFINNGGPAFGAVSGGHTTFNGNSTAGNGTFTNNGGATLGYTEFLGSSTAGDATLTNNGGYTVFAGTSNAGNATLIANAVTGGGVASAILFEFNATGGTAQVQVFGNGNVDISDLTSPGITLGSIEGSGNGFLGAKNLTVGSNNLSRTFSGVLQDGGPIAGGVGGSFTKIGTGTLTLTGTNPYTGSTTVNGGTLLVNGALAATSAVTVNNGGTLGGTGTVNGPVTVASAGILTPGSGSGPGTLTVGTLTLNSGSILNYQLATPGMTGGGINSLTTVNGNLTLAGGTLNIAGLAGFGAGTYDLINYTGTLTGSALSLGTLPAGFTASQFTIQTSVPNEIDLIVTSALAPTIWTWNAGSAEWQTPNWVFIDSSSIQHFGVPTAADTAVINNGSVVQITTPGAVAQVLEITGATGSGISILNGGILTNQTANVGDGSSGATATVTGIGSTWNVTGTIQLGNGLFDSGSLTVTQGGQVNAQSIIVGGANGALGTLLVSEGGTVTVDGGTGTLVTTNAIFASIIQIGNGGAAGTINAGLINNGGIVEFDHNQSSYTFAPQITGSGTLTQAGTGTTTMTALNSVVGFLQADQGVLIVTGSLTAGTGGFGTAAASFGANAGDNATFIVNGGGVFSASGISGVGIASAATSTATVTVTGSGSTWNGGSGELEIGDAGTASFTVSNGASFNHGGTGTFFTPINIGNQAGSNGTLTITDAGTTWTNVGNSVTIGNSGTGVLNVLAGASVSSNGASLAMNAGSTGTANVSGLNSVWNVGGSLIVGQSGNGTLNISNGAAVISGDQSTINWTAPATGAATVTGIGSSWHVTGALDISDGGGSGTLTATNGGTVTTDGWIWVGRYTGGQGTLTISNGGIVTSAEGLVGSGSTSGIVTVTGVGSTWNMSGDLNINGYDSSGAYLQGMTISAGGSVNIGNVFVGTNNVAINGLTVTGSGSALNASGIIAIGAGTMIISNSATVTVASGTGSLYVGYGFNVSGGILQIGEGGAAGVLNAANVLGAGGPTPSLLFDHNELNYVFSPNISGNIALDSAGSGVTTLSGANTYTGTTGVNSGTLQAGSSTGFSPNSAFTVVASAFLDVNGFDPTAGSLTGNGVVTNSSATPGALSVGSDNTDTSFSGTLQNGAGTLSLIKAGIGALTLTGTNTYTGVTTINAGTLLVHGSLAAGSATTVNNGGTLGGTGTVHGPVTVASGGILAPGPGSGPGTLTVGTLTLNSGSLLNYQLGTPGVVGGGVNSLTIVNGNLTLAGGTLNIAGLVGFGAGTYDLINYTGTLTGSALSLGTLPAGYTAANFTIQTSVPNQIDLIVTTGAASTVQYWNGPNATATGTVTGGTGTWNNVATNWTNSTGSANSNWQQGAAIVSAGSGTVTVGDRITVGELHFLPGSGAYTIATNGLSTALTFTGAGITNDSGILQNFVNGVFGPGNYGDITFSGNATAGSLTAFTNYGSGSSFYFGGYIWFGNNSTAGSALFTNNAGTVANAYGGSTEFFDSASAGNGSFTNNGATVSGGTSVAPNYSGYTEFNDTSSAGSATFTNNAGTVSGAEGGATLFFQNSSASNGAFTNNAAAVNGAQGGATSFYGTSTAGGASFTNNGSAISGANGGVTQFFNTATAGSGLFMNNGASASGAFGGSTLFVNTASAGSATITNNGGTVSGAGGGQTSFTNSSSAGSATLIANGGTGGGLGGQIRFAGASTGGTARVEVFGNGAMDLSALTAPGLTTGSIEGSGIIFLGAKNLTVGSNNLSTTFSGAIQDGGFNGGVGGSFTKSGTSTLTLTGINTYTGATTVNGGKLLVNGSLVATSAVTVNSGSTLGGTGTINGPVTVASGGILMPGPSTGPGTLTVGTLSLNSGSILTYLLGTPGVVGGGVNSLLTVNGNLTLGGATLNIVPFSGFGPGVYDLIDYSGTLTGSTLNLGTLPSGMVTSQFTILTSVPNRIELVVTAFTPPPPPPPTLQYWNGPNTIATGSVTGGTGTWDNLTTNWTNSAGSANANWQQAAAAFSAGAGTVILGDNITATELRFLPGSGAYTISTTGTTLNAGLALTISGVGVTNTSGVVQNFLNPVNGLGGNGFINFQNNATAGSLVTYANAGATFAGGNGGSVNFQNNSTAGSATFINQGGAVSGISQGFTAFLNGSTAANATFINNAGTANGATGGDTSFQDNATAANATFTNNGAAVVGGGGGFTSFSNTSTAANGIFTNNGATISGGGAGVTIFHDTSTAGNGTFTSNGSAVAGARGGATTFADASTAGNATIIANTGTGGGLGGRIIFSGTADAGTATMQIFGNASLDISQLTAPSLAVSSLTGSGNVFLGANSLALGGNNLPATFSGVIQDGGIIAGVGGSLTKIGTAALTLTGLNNYTGATTVNAGTLLVNGSLAAASAVTVNSGGTLGGTGTIGGPVTVASSGALAPGSGAASGTLTLGTLTLNNGSLLNYQLATPGVVGGGINSLLTVNGNLTLNGATLNISGLAGFAAGTYDLINYTGTLTGSALTLGTLPAGYTAADFTIQTSVANEIDLVVTSTAGPTIVNALGPNTVPDRPASDILIQSMGTSGVVPIAAATTNVSTLTQSFTTASTIDTSAGMLRVGVNGGVYINPGDAALTIGTVPGSGVLTAGGNAANVAGVLNLGNNSASLLTINSVIPDNGTGVVSVVMNGAGTTMLTATNTYTGGTTINAGLLNFNSLANFGTGPITLNGGGLQWATGTSTDISGKLAALGASGAVFDTNGATVTFASPLSGNGGLTKSGAGILSLTALNQYTGDTIVHQGVLFVDGSIASTTTSVDPGAMLGGTGLIKGSVVNSGFVSPGDPPGTLTIAGDYTQSPNGTLLIRIGGLQQLQYDLLVVGGRANLAGTLQIVRLNGFRFSSLGQSVTFLTAGRGISGTFANTINPFGSGTMIGTQIVYTPNSVSIEAVQNSFVSLLNAFGGGTPNEQSVAHALDASSADSRNRRLLAYLDRQSLTRVIGALDLIAPEEMTSIYQVAFSEGEVQMSNLERRLDDIRSGSNGFSAMRFSMSRPSPDDSGLSGPSGDKGPLGVAGAKAKGNGDVILNPSPNNRWGVFVTGNGEWANLGNTSNARGYDLLNAGVTLGIDFKATDNFAMGLGLGYDHTTVDLTGSGRVTVGGGKLAVYATGFTENGFYADCVAQAGYNSYDTHRAALQGDARSSTTGGQIIVLAGTGYDFKAGGVTFGPTATFKYINVGFNSFTEEGSLAPLHYPHQHQESITTAIGAKASYERKIGTATFRPELRVRWKHEYSDNTVAVDSGFANGAGPDFTVHGPEIGRDSMLLGAGFSILWSDRFSTNLFYDGELFRTNFQTSNVTGSFRLIF